MNRKLLVPLFGSALLAFSGCGWQLPEKVSVKTNAEYELGLGDSVSQMLSSTSAFQSIDIRQSIESGMGDTSDGAAVYDYFPDSKNENLKQLLMMRPVYSFTIDFSDSNITSLVNSAAALASQFVEIPMTYTQTISVSYDMPLGVNFGTIMNSFDTFGDDFKDNLYFKSVPIALFAGDTTSEAFASAEIKGAVSLFYRTADSTDALSKFQYLLGEGDTTSGVTSSHGSLKFVQNPDLEPDENKLVTKNFNEAIKGKGAVAADVAATLNTRIKNEDGTPNDAATLYMRTDLDSITVPTALAQQGESHTITIYAYIDIQLDFLLTKDATMEIIKNESVEGEETEETSELPSNPFIDVLKEGYVVLTPTALPFVIKPAATNGALNVELKFGEVPITFGLTDVGNPATGTISNANLKKMLAGGSMGSPELSLIFPKGELKMPREMDFAAEMIVGIKTDGDIQVYPEFGGSL